MKKNIHKKWYINWLISFAFSIIYLTFMENNATIALILYFGIAILSNQYEIMKRI